MTRKIYLADTYLFQEEAVLLERGEDERGQFVILDQTIFYPQGGGQPSDHGVINCGDCQLEIIKVVQSDELIKHYFSPVADQIAIGSQVVCLLDQDRRLLNSRCHTAAHLLGNIVEILYPTLKAVKGHSFPGEAFVEFQGEQAIDLANVEKEVNQAIARNYQTKILEIDRVSFEQDFYKLPYEVAKDKKFRVMQIGDLLPVPCGGTHLLTIGEVGKMTIGKIKSKNQMTKISYSLS